MSTKYRTGKKKKKKKGFTCHQKRKQNRDKTLTTPSQNPDFSSGVNISTGSTSSYSSISGGAVNQDYQEKGYISIGMA